MSSFRKDTSIEKIRKTSKSLNYSYCLNYEFHSIPNAHTLSKYVEHPSCTISKLKERWYRQYRVFVKSSIFSLSSSLCLGYSKYCYMWKQTMSNPSSRYGFGVRLFNDGSLKGAAFMSNIKSFIYKGYDKSSSVLRMFRQSIENQKEKVKIFQVGYIIGTTHSFFPLLARCTLVGLHEASTLFLETPGKSKPSIVNLFSLLGWKYVFSISANVSLFYISRHQYSPFFEFEKVKCTTSGQQRPETNKTATCSARPQRKHRKVQLKSILKRGKKKYKKHVQWAPRIATYYL